MASMTIDCPSCSRKLRVRDELMGKRVKCPTCEHTFAASSIGEAPTVSVPGDIAAKPPVESRDSGFPAQIAAESAEQAATESGGERENLRPCPYCGERIGKHDHRCRYCGEVPDDAEEEDDRPWEESQRFRGRRDAEPHRGTLILVFGILSIVAIAVCGPVGLPFGIAAWVMGRGDLRKIRANLMDPQGQGTTQAGYICGIIGTILDSLYALACLGYIAVLSTLFGTMRARPPAPAPIPPPAAPPPPGKQVQAEFLLQRWQDYLPWIRC